MKKYFMQLVVFAFAMMGLSTPVFAQMYGTGMGAIQQSCPYNPTMGDEAQSIQDDISEQQQRLRELQAELREAKADKKEVERKMSASRRSLERQGIQEEYLTKLIDHITEMRSCTEYEGNRVPGGKQVRGTASVDSPVEEENTVSTTTVGNGKIGTEPYTNRQWADICDYTKKGRVRDAACSEAVVGPSLVSKPGYNPQACRNNLKAYQDAQEKLRKHENRIAALEGEISNTKEAIAAFKGDLREAQREYAREQREQMTEGGCVDCMLQGAGFVYQKPKTDWGGVAVNSVLGIASMFLGNDLQKYVANQNARIGAQTPGAFPSFGFGFPFMMGAIGAATGGGGGMYGAVGGGIGQGAFGCANGFGGNGYGNMVGGAMGYPAGYYGSPYGGGAYAGMPMGMYGAGMGYPMGMMVGGGIGMGMPVSNGMPMGMMAGGGMMGYPMGGMAGGMMGMMAGGGMMMGGGYPMGGMMGGSMMGYPMGGMAGGMMGMMAGGGMMMGGGYPMGGMMGAMGGYPMGGMAGGMMGMMAGGGMMMGGGYPMGGMMGYPMGGMAGGMMGMMAGGGMMMGGGYPMGGMMGMGMDSSAMMNAQMQMQQQQMQMYMQQQQMMMSAYQRAQENEMNKQRTLMGLQQELQGLIMRMQQVQYSSSTGGYLDYGAFYGGSSISGSPFSNGSNFGGGLPGSPFGNPGTGSVTPTGSAIPSTR